MINFVFYINAVVKEGRMIFSPHPWIAPAQEFWFPSKNSIVKLLPRHLYKLHSSRLHPQPSHINPWCVWVWVCVLGSGGVSARVLLTPQGVKDFWTNTASFKNKLFDFSLLKLFFLLSYTNRCRGRYCRHLHPVRVQFYCNFVFADHNISSYLWSSAQVFVYLLEIQLSSTIHILLAPCLCVCVWKVRIDESILF